MSESEIIKNITASSEKQQRALGDTIVRLRTRLHAYEAKEMPVESIAEELSAQYPVVAGLTLTRGATYKMQAAKAGEAVANAEGTAAVQKAAIDSLAAPLQPVLADKDAIVALVRLNAPLQAGEQERISRWLAARLKVTKVQLLIVE